MFDFVRVSTERNNIPDNTRDTLDRRSSENQKYYATIHKVGLTNSDKIPGDERTILFNE